MTIIVKKPGVLHNKYHPEKEEKPIVESTTKTSEDVHGGDEITQSVEDVRFSQQINTQYTQQQDNNGQQSEMNDNISQSTQADNNTYDKQGLQQTNEESIQQPSSNDQQNNEDNGQHQSTSQQQSTNQQNNVDESTQQNDEQQGNNDQQSEMNGDAQQNQNNDIQPNDAVSRQQPSSNDNDTQQSNNIPQSNEYNTQNSTTCDIKSTQQSSTDTNQQNEDDNQNDTEQQEDDNQLDDSTSDESEDYDNDYEDDNDYDYEEDDEQEDTPEYNTQQAFEINNNAIKRQLFLTFYRLVEYLSDEEKQPTLLPGQSLVLNVKRLMMRQYERKPLSAYYYYKMRTQAILILDNSGSMKWVFDELDTFFAAALKRKDVQIYIAPNGHIESYYDYKTKRFEVIDHNEAIQQIIRSGLPVIYVGDFDGANTPIELSWTNRVYWICTEKRYKYFSHHDWVGRCLKEDEDGNCIKFKPYHEDDFKGFFGRTFNDKEMIEVLQQFARNIHRQQFWYDKHDITDFKEEY